jgi:hypothetical protein
LQASSLLMLSPLVKAQSGARRCASARSAARSYEAIKATIEPKFKAMTGAPRRVRRWRAARPHQQDGLRRAGATFRSMSSTCRPIRKPTASSRTCSRAVQPERALERGQAAARSWINKGYAPAREWIVSGILYIEERIKAAGALAECRLRSIEGSEDGGARGAARDRQSGGGRRSSARSRRT